MKELNLQLWLAELAQVLVRAVLDQDMDVREGVVMTSGKQPYRRLDCDGRALAYIRVRPKKRAVRVDISGLWNAASKSRLRVKSAGGSATLMIRSEADVPDAVRFLINAVNRTRAYESPAA